MMLSESAKVMFNCLSALIQNHFLTCNIIVNTSIVKMEKPIIGITTGDLNGVGVETIIKTLSDNRMIEFCTPVIFGSNKVINFYRKLLPEFELKFASIKSFDAINPKQVNIFNCWE